MTSLILFARHATWAGMVLLPVLVYAAPFRWTTFTSTSDVVDIVVAGEHIWAATTGGLSDYDASSGAFTVYTNTSGLPTNQCLAVGRDAQGYIWAALNSPPGMLVRVDPVTGLVRQVADLQNEVYKVYDILAVGNEVFVATDNGIYRFAYQPTLGQFANAESIRQLGTFSVDTDVKSLAVCAGYLYAGTDVGLARASLSNPPLGAPSAWETFTPANSPLPERAIIAMQGYDSLLLLSTPSYVLSIRDTAFAALWSLAVIVDFAENRDGNAIWAATPWQVYRLGTQDWLPVGGALPGISDAEILHCNGTCMVVAALRDTENRHGGLAFSSWPTFTGWSEPLTAHSVGGNYITALALDPQGRLWVGGGGSTSGVFVREGTTWTNYYRGTDHAGRFLRYAPLSFVFDNHGGTWVSSLGGGVAWFRDSLITVFNREDSSGFFGEGSNRQPRLMGIRSDANYIETRLARDVAGNVFLTVLETATGRSLILIPERWIARGNNPDAWTYFLAGVEGSEVDYKAVGEVLVDHFRRVWAGAGRNGRRTFVLNMRGTPEDSTDDTWFAYEPKDRQDNLTCSRGINQTINKEVLDWAVDRRGYLWVGTVNGAYYTQSGIPADLSQLRFICVADLPIGQRVNAIHVDAHDNKWFGTDAGVAVLDTNFAWIHVFQTAASMDHRSDLVSNDVRAIVSNPRTGEVWIGTTDGLSRFESPYLSTGENLSQVHPYPNPFRADGTQRMRVDHQRLGGRFDELRIFTLNGALVRKLSWQQMTDPVNGGWDGRNEKGTLVAGGVYLLLVSRNDGQASIGKVAVLGR